mgnify:FL=1
MEKKRKYIEEFFPDVMLCDGHDNAILGVVESFSKPAVVLYDKEQIIENLMADMSEDEAIEYFYFNIEGAYVGEYTPQYATIIKENNAI